jgi:hypothetical protein
VLSPYWLFFSYTHYDSFIHITAIKFISLRTVATSNTASSVDGKRHEAEIEHLNPGEPCLGMEVDIGDGSGHHNPLFSDRAICGATTAHHHLVDPTSK